MHNLINGEERETGQINMHAGAFLGVSYQPGSICMPIIPENLGMQIKVAR